MWLYLAFFFYPFSGVYFSGGGFFFSSVFAVCVSYYFGGFYISTRHSYVHVRTPYCIGRDQD